MCIGMVWYWNLNACGLWAGMRVGLEPIPYCKKFTMNFQTYITIAYQYLHSSINGSVYYLLSINSIKD